MFSRQPHLLVDVALGLALGLFFAMHQHLCDSMHFLYKHQETTYEDLLSATQKGQNGMDRK